MANRMSNAAITKAKWAINALRELGRHTDIDDVFRLEVNGMIGRVKREIKKQQVTKHGGKTDGNKN